MFKKKIRTVVLVMASGVSVSGVLSHAQAPNTSPNQQIIPTPMQIAVQKAVQESTQSTPHASLPNAQIATQNAQNATQNTLNTTANAMPGAQMVQPTHTPTAQLPAESAAIAAMESAKSALQKAGNKWGGHKGPAIRLINTALAGCGQEQTTTPAETDSSPQDQSAAMQSGVTQLTNAKSDFEKVGKGWGACRPEVLSLVDQALKDLEAGIEFAKIHNNF